MNHLLVGNTQLRGTVLSDRRARWRRVGPLVGPDVHSHSLRTGDTVEILADVQAVQVVEQVHVRLKDRIRTGVDRRIDLAGSGRQAEIAGRRVDEQRIVLQVLQVSQIALAEGRLERGDVVDGGAASPLDPGGAAGLIQHIVVHLRVGRYRSDSDADMVRRLSEIRYDVVGDRDGPVPPARVADATVHVVQRVAHNMELRSGP